MIFQSSLAIPGGVTASLKKEMGVEEMDEVYECDRLITIPHSVCCALPSVLIYVAVFSVYAAPGKITSAM